MQSRSSREIHLASYPSSIVPDEANFLVSERPVPTPEPGEILVRNIWMSVDPYMVGRMRKPGGGSYVGEFLLGQALDGHAVGQVVESNGNAQFEVGDYVLGMNGWREWFTSDGKHLAKVDPAGMPIEAQLGILGHTGLTAYAGLLRVASLKDGERVFVSAAAGAVGLVACQIAKAKGCYVVGSAGSDAKCDLLLNEAGVDKAINYKSCGDLTAALGAAAPEGIDVYFDNVGGAHLNAAIANMRHYGRVALCGLMSGQSGEGYGGPADLTPLIVKGINLRGFLLGMHLDMQPQFARDMKAWLDAGLVKDRSTALEGLENAPKALIGLFKGDNVGKMLVRIGPDDPVGRKD